MGRSRKLYYKGGSGANGIDSRNNVPLQMKSALGEDNVRRFHEILANKGVAELDKLVMNGDIEEANMLEWAGVLPECLEMRRELAPVAEGMVKTLLEGKVTAGTFNESITRGGKIAKNKGIYWLFAVIGSFLKSQNTFEKNTFKSYVFSKFIQRVFALMVHAFTDNLDAMHAAHTGGIFMQKACEEYSGAQLRLSSTTNYQPLDVLKAVVAEVCKDFHFPHGTGIISAIRQTGLQVSQRQGRLTYMEQEMIKRDGKANVTKLKEECEELLFDIIGLAGFRQITLHKVDIGKSELCVYGDEMKVSKYSRPSTLCYARLHLDKGMEFKYPQESADSSSITVQYEDGCIEIMVDRSNGELYISPTFVPLSFFLDEQAYQYLRRHLLLSLKSYLDAKEDDIMPVGDSERVVARRLARQRAVLAAVLAAQTSDERKVMQALKAEERAEKSAGRAETGESTEGPEYVTDGGETVEAEVQGKGMDDSIPEDTEPPMPKRVRVSFAAAGAFTDPDRFAKALRKLFHNDPAQNGGSHAIFKLSDYRGEAVNLPGGRNMIIVSMHSVDLPKACVCKALRTLNLTAEEFAQYY